MPHWAAMKMVLSTACGQTLSSGFSPLSKSVNLHQSEWIQCIECRASDGKIFLIVEGETGRHLFKHKVAKCRQLKVESDPLWYWNSSSVYFARSYCSVWIHFISLLVSWTQHVTNRSPRVSHAAPVYPLIHLHSPNWHTPCDPQLHSVPGMSVSVTIICGCNTHLRHSQPENI